MATVNVKNLKYAKLNADTKDALAYDGLKDVAPSVQIQISPQVNFGQLFGDGQVQETDTAEGPMEVTINTTDLPLEVQADLLGHEINGYGEMVKNKDDVPPYVAILFEAPRSNGTSVNMALLKGRFSAPEQNFQTKSDNVQYNTPSISARFIPRVYDGDSMRTGDTAYSGFTRGGQWFDSVEPNQDSTAPTVNVSPADDAASVAVDADIVWTFDEAIQKRDVTDTNFMVTDETGTEVAGSLTLSADMTTVTFSPESALTAATGYTAIVTKAVRDLAGNHLASSEFTNFTTA